MKMRKILSNYPFCDSVIDVSKYGGGHINKTYLITTYYDKDAKYILQEINSKVFRRPKVVMRNIDLVTNFIREKALSINLDVSRVSLEIIPTFEGKNYVRIGDEYWRCFRFVNGTKTYEYIEKPSMFYEAGKAVGYFQKLLEGFPIRKLGVTIPNFHNTPVRYQKFLEISNLDKKKRGLDIYNEISFVLDRKDKMSIITDLLDKKIIPYRVTHNDTKLNNIMFDETTDKAICVIDLDTVMPGSILYDFGDAIRIGASTAKEDEVDLDKVKLDLVLFEEFTNGFLKYTHDLLTQEELDNLVNSVIVITLECGMRFLTDYLDGDNYFSIDPSRPQHNLERARAQFKLVKEAEEKYDEMEKIVKKLYKKYKEKSSK